MPDPLYRIHPCVEINLRMNMGMVARCLYDRYVVPGGEGVFRVAYHATPGEALTEHERMATRISFTHWRGKSTFGLSAVGARYGSQFIYGLDTYRPAYLTACTAGPSLP